ncbi:MAG TPA: hypothetical protein VFM99_05390 [Chitinophagales bacterium]|nr:hypothetical protein [Chitinophagales bacterium]
MGITTLEPGMYKEPNSVWGKLWILIFIILFTTRILTKSTLTDYYTYVEVFWYIFITMFSFVYLFYVLLIRKSLDEMNYLYVMMFILPLLSAVAANIAEGQSIPGGLLAQRHWFGLGGIFLIIFLLKKHFFTINDLFRSMEWLGWLCLLFYLYCYIFLDAEKYSEYSFVGYSDLKGGYRFRFGVDFISFLSLYYMIKFITEKKQRYVWLAIIQLAYLFFLHQGRIVMLSVVAGIFLYYLIEVNWKRTLIYSLVAGTVFLILMTILSFAFPEFAARYMEQYTNVILVFLGQETGEGSVEARVEETAIVLIYLASYPIGWVIGVGKYGADYSDPDNPITSIAPGDIGILGSIITYGILGTLIMYFQFFIAFRSMKFVKRYRKDVYYITSVYFLFYCFATSLAKGNLFTQPGSTAIFILIIYAFKLLEVHQAKEQKLAEQIAVA